MCVTAPLQVVLSDAFVMLKANMFLVFLVHGSLIVDQFKRKSKKEILHNQIPNGQRAFEMKLKTKLGIVRTVLLF